jgi:hypothetical protein
MAGIALAEGILDAALLISESAAEVAEGAEEAIAISEAITAAEEASATALETSELAAPIADSNSVASVGLNALEDTESGSDMVAQIRVGLEEEGFDVADDGAIDDGDTVKVDSDSIEGEDDAAIQDDDDATDPDKANTRTKPSLNDSETDTNSKVRNLLSRIPFKAALFLILGAAFLVVVAVGALLRSICKGLQKLRGGDPKRCDTSACNALQNLQYLFQEYGWILIGAILAFGVYRLIMHGDLPIPELVIAAICYLVGSNIGSLTATVGCDILDIPTATKCIFRPSTCGA